MSNYSFSNWLTANKAVNGLLALAVAQPGEAPVIEPCRDNLPATLLETAWRALAETISVLQLNSFPTGSFRFVFGQALVHCERREDGMCIGIFAGRGHDYQLAEGDLDRLLSEFHAL